MKNQLWVFAVCLTLLSAAILLGNFLPSQSVSGAISNDKYTFILDAGHGGEDGGALTSSGVKESDINLCITLRLDYLMGFCGMDTVLVRREDVSIHDSSAKTLREKKVSDLRNRVALIEGEKAALLVSIHQNSYTDSRYSGAQVFYRNTEFSRLWGEKTQRLLASVLDPKNERAAKEIPDSVYLMNHINCPGILVECGFLSNEQEAARLQTEPYQKKIALVLAGACMHAEQMIPAI